MIVKHDWDALFKEYERQSEKDSQLTQQDYAKSLNINVTSMSRAFSEIRKADLARLREKTERKLARILPETADILIEQLRNSEDAAVKSKVAFGILDRAGFSPQAVAVQVNTQVNASIVVPVLFASAHTEDVAKMLKPRKVVDVDAQAE